MSGEEEADGFAVAVWVKVAAVVLSAPFVVYYGLRERQDSPGKPKIISGREMQYGSDFYRDAPNRNFWDFKVRISCP